MGLVFMALVLLWGLMALTVRLTSKEAREEQAQGPQAQEASETTSQDGQMDLKYRAAAAAVSVALALAASRTAASQPAPTAVQASIEPWAAAHRASYLSQLSNLYVKKGKR